MENDELRRRLDVLELAFISQTIQQAETSNLQTVLEALQTNAGSGQAGAASRLLALLQQEKQANEQRKLQQMLGR